MIAVLARAAVLLENGLACLEGSMRLASRDDGRTCLVRAGVTIALVFLLLSCLRFWNQMRTLLTFLSGTHCVSRIAPQELWLLTSQPQPQVLPWRPCWDEYLPDTVPRAFGADNRSSCALAASPRREGSPVRPWAAMHTYPGQAVCLAARVWKQCESESSDAGGLRCPGRCASANVSCGAKDRERRACLAFVVGGRQQDRRRTSKSCSIKVMEDDAASLDSDVRGCPGWNSNQNLNLKLSPPNPNAVP